MMIKKPALFWIFWLILACITLLLMHAPLIAVEEKEYRVEYTIWTYMGYTASNGTKVYIGSWEDEVKCKINELEIGPVSHRLDIKSGTEAAPVITKELYHVLIYLIADEEVYFLNLSHFKYESYTLLDYLSNTPLKPEPIYTTARNLMYMPFWENEFYGEECYAEKDMLSLLVEKYYQLTGRESGVVDAYINVTSLLMIYTGHQFLSVVHKWNIVKLKIHYRNLTVVEAYLEGRPHHIEKIKLKVIPPTAIVFAGIACKILFPLSIILLLIGLYVRSTRSIIRIHLRKVAVTMSLILLLLAFTLRLGEHNTYMLYIGFYDLTVNGEPWPGRVEGDTLVIDNIGNETLRAPLIFYRVSDRISYTYVFLTLEVDGERERLYRTAYPWENVGYNCLLISKVGVPLKAENATVRLRVKALTIGYQEDRVYDILTFRRNGNIVRIKPSPMLIVYYERPPLNEINLLLAAMGAGILVYSIKSPVNKKYTDKTNLTSTNNSTAN